MKKNICKKGGINYLSIDPHPSMPISPVKNLLAPLLALVWVGRAESRDLTLSLRPSGSCFLKSLIPVLRWLDA